MKPAPFEYQAPSSLSEALDSLATFGSDAKVLAGGQSLIPVLNFRLAQPAVLIDINRLDGLSFLRAEEGGGLHLGALVRHRALERHSLVAERAPLLHDAAFHIAHPQIRNRGTLGGSLAHADPAAELPALAVALRARFRLQKADGDRWVDAVDFYQALFTTSLEPEEILTEVIVPALPASAGWGFEEVARRHGDYAQVGAAAVVDVDGHGRCREARLVFFSVGDTPIEARQATGGMSGEALTDATLDHAAAHAAEHEIEPTGDIHATSDFKRHLARVVARRALRQARDRAQAGGAAPR